MCVSWVSQISTNTTFFPKPATTFSHASAEVRGENTPEKKVRLNRGLNSEPPGHDYDTLATELPGRDTIYQEQ